MKILITASESLIRLTHNMAAIFLAIAFVLVFYQVVTRFVFGDAAAWSEILARAVIIWTVFLVCGAAIRLGRMIPIDAIKNMAPRGAQIWLTRLVTLATLLVLGVLIWFGTRMTMHVADQQVAMINVSVSWFYAALPIGSALAIPGLFLAMIDSERKFRDPGSDETAVEAEEAKS